MVRVRHAALAAAMMTAMGTPVAAQVLDATYRGTMPCDKLPFTSDKMREAIEVTISGGAARYSHVVRLSKVAVEAAAEQGSGKIDGAKIDLQELEKRQPGLRGEIQRQLRAAQRQTQGHADLDRRRQDRHPRLRGCDQAAAETIFAARQEAGGSALRLRPIALPKQRRS
jgi:hypothetical protein